MSASRRGFRRNDDGVSEVIGFILSFMVAFVLLVTMLSAFNIMASYGRDQAASAELEDVANRVSGASLELLAVGSNLRQSLPDVASGYDTPLVYRKVLDISQEFRGIDYVITLTPQNVWVNSTDGNIKENASTLKADVLLPPGGVCDASYIICEMQGVVPARSPTVTVIYEYQTFPSINRISIE